MESDAVTGAGTRPGHTTICSTSFAYTSQDEVVIQSLDQAEQQYYRQVSRRSHSPLSVLALSYSGCRLAIANREKVQICGSDLEPLHCLCGNGRYVTCLSWSPHGVEQFAAGSIDGSILIWSLDGERKLQQQLCFTYGPCLQVAFSAVDRAVLASGHGSTVAVWSLGRPRKPVKIIDVGRTQITAMVWHPSLSSRLLTVSDDNVVRIWEVTQLGGFTHLHTQPDSSDDEEIFGHLDDLHNRRLNPIAQLRFMSRPIAVDWIGEHGLYVVLPDDAEVQIYSFGSDWEMLHQIWRSNLTLVPEAAVLRQASGFVLLTAAARGLAESRSIPATVLDGVGGYVAPASAPALSVTHKTRQHMVADTNRLPGGTCNRNSHFRPISIDQLRAEKASLCKTYRHLTKSRDGGIDGKRKPLGKRRRTSSTRSKQTALSRSDGRPKTPSTPLSKPMTSSLELPKTRNGSDASLMPFLSPGIPARKPSPNDVPSIEDTLELSRIQSASDNSVALMTDQESESDDESYQPALIGSGSFRPGGINVPLPKGCGALFAPNGQLVTFFPPRPRPAGRVGLEDLGGDHQPGKQEQAEPLANLFPTFGNLMSGGEAEADIERLDGGLAGPVDNNDVGPSPLNRTLPYSTKKVSPSNREEHSPPHHKVVISVIGLDNITAAAKSAATKYISVLGPGLTPAEVCNCNASVAGAAGLTASKEVWKLLSDVLNGYSPEVSRLPDMSSGYFGLSQAVKVGVDAYGMLPSTGGAISGPEKFARGPLRSDLPHGRAWLVGKCIAWGERLADMQLLALMTAILLQAQHANDMRRSAHTISGREADPVTPSQRGSTTSIHRRSSSGPTIPILRSDSELASFTFNSPAKSRQPSQGSSRDASQPTTPYLDSGESTPPLSLPPMSRSATKLSSSGGTTGTSSPEHQRSSFSAAARHYAQSITERFASYGSSPPTKKSGSSPGSGEFSSGLPYASGSGGGSWGKTVSFASTASNARESQLSRSYTTLEADEYDSDRTIDDTSQPHTPRTGQSSVAVKLPNHDVFGGEGAGRLDEPLLSAEMAAKAQIWCASYAEQLRCWGMWMQAAELEKAISCPVSPTPGQKIRDSIQPDRASEQRRATCNICENVINALYQLCPKCLHHSHIQCLEMYVDTLDTVEEFECPSGCGCSCDRLEFEPVEISPPEDPEVSPRSKNIRKKASFTDPRRWRARIEGDSW